MVTSVKSQQGTLVTYKDDIRGDIQFLANRSEGEEEAVAGASDNYYIHIYTLYLFR